MKKCIIFCAGGFDGLLAPVEDAFVIAADGGLRHARSAGITPDRILGDFDSLGYTPEGSCVYPVEKDDTDAMLAVRTGLELGCREFYLYGSLDGDRLDHTVANFQTLQFLADRGAIGYLVGKRYLATVIREETIAFGPEAEGILSLFCLGPDANGVTLEGLQYSMAEGKLTSGFPLGVSNHFVGQQACVTVRDGSLLALWDKKNGLPTRFKSF